MVDKEELQELSKALADLQEQFKSNKIEWSDFVAQAEALKDKFFNLS